MTALTSFLPICRAIITVHPPALAMVALARQYVSHDGARHRQLIRPERPAKHVPGELTNVGQQPAQGRAALSR